MLRFLILLLLAAQASAPAAATPPGWAMPVLEQGLAAHRSGDFGTARRSFMRLAAQGSAIGETMLGAMAAAGEGQRRDLASAATWWLRAANRGYAPAQLAIAGAFARGEGVARDRGTAWVWAWLAQVHGDAAIAARAKMLAAQLEKGFTPAEIARLDKRRQAWRPWPTFEG